MDGKVCNTVTDVTVMWDEMPGKQNSPLGGVTTLNALTTPGFLHPYRPLARDGQDKKMRKVSYFHHHLCVAPCCIIGEQDT